MHTIIKRTWSLLIAILSIPAVFTIIPAVAHAETHVFNADVANGALWTASSSPYILEESITVSSGAVLSVDPGVVIEADPAIDPDYTPSISIYGSLTMNGNQDNHITVKSLYSINVCNATATISYADIYPDSSGEGLYLMRSNASISSSTISGANQGIYIQSGTLNIESSRIENNNYGIWVQKYAPVFLMMDWPANKSLQVADADVSFGASDLRAEDNHPATIAVDSDIASGNLLPPAVVTISGSSFVDNSTDAIKNTETDPVGMVMAADNWWGSANGPITDASAGASSLNASSSVIAGLVIYNPWLDHDPTRSSDKPKCCSSILFLPGIESSRLYRDEKGILGSGIGPGTSPNMLWEPNRNDDVRKLFLNTDGSSADKTVYSGGAIDSAWGYSVYGSFMKFLDGLVAKGSINNWNAFGYDWRKPIAEVVAGPEKKATTTVSLVQTLIDMASSSKTGKVTLIAHSNGGLVAKYLTKTLADMGKDNLIDSVISVAVPYLGTPEAVGGILHGDDEELADGWLLKQSVARQLGANMASAYSLLPSAMYFTSASPVITFSSTTPRTVNNGVYPSSISSFSSLSSFMTDSKNIRSAPAADDTESPIEGNKALMASAGNLHNILDLFSWPAHIARWAVVGWNALTTKGIVYHASTGSTAQNPTPAHDTVQTNMGDGTVVTRSAAYDDGTTTNIDLQTPGVKGTLHGNILESVTAQNAISGILEDSPAAAKERALMSIPGVTVGPLDYSKERTYIQVSTHSPIQPQVYDSHGNHTGETVPPPGMPTDVFRTYDNQIPGSSFRVDEHNDTDYDTYISLPDDGTKYSVVLNGTAVGSFTFDVDRIRGGVTLDHAEYADLPVTPLTIATTTIQFSPTDIPTPPGIPFGIASSTFMKTIQPLSIDVDGDGVPDIQAKQGSTTDKTAYWESLRKACDTIFDTNVAKPAGKGDSSGNAANTNQFCKGISSRIDHIEDLIKKGKFKKLHDFSDKIGQYMQHRRSKNLSDTDKQEVGDMFDNFVSQFE